MMLNLNSSIYSSLENYQETFEFSRSGDPMQKQCKHKLNNIFFIDKSNNINSTNTSLLYPNTY